MPAMLARRRGMEVVSSHESVWLLWCAAFFVLFLLFLFLSLFFVLFFKLIFSLRYFLILNAFYSDIFLLKLMLFILKFTYFHTIHCHLTHTSQPLIKSVPPHTAYHTHTNYQPYPSTHHSTPPCTQTVHDLGDDLEKTLGSGEMGRSVVHSSREFQGMLEYRREDEGVLVRSLIIGGW